MALTDRGEFGKFLRAQRVSRQLTPVDVANQLGISTASLYYYEGEKRPGSPDRFLPPRERIVHLGEILGFDADTIIKKYGIQDQLGKRRAAIKKGVTGDTSGVTEPGLHRDEVAKRIRKKNPRISKSALLALTHAAMRARGQGMGTPLGRPSPVIPLATYGGIPESPRLAPRIRKPGPLPKPKDVTPEKASIIRTLRDKAKSSLLQLVKPKTFGQLIKKRRLEAGYSTKEMAELLDIPEEKYLSAEEGKAVDLELVAKISQEWGIKVEELQAKFSDNIEKVHVPDSIPPGALFQTPAGGPDGDDDDIPPKVTGKPKFRSKILEIVTPTNHGQALKKLRLTHNLSLDEVEALSGIPSEQLDKYERNVTVADAESGKRLPLLTLENAQSLAKAYGFDIREFIKQYGPLRHQKMSVPSLIDETTKRKTLGGVLRNARKRKGYSSEQVARLAGVSSSFIRQLETGAMAVSKEAIDAIGNVLGFKRTVLENMGLGPFPPTSRLKGRFTKDPESEARERQSHIDKIMAHLDKQERAPQKVVGEAHEAPKVKKIKVGVVGPLKSQYDELKRLAPENVELVFLDRDHMPNELPLVDKLLLWARFVTHSVQDRAISTYGRAKVIPQHGGLSTLLEAMTNISTGKPVAQFAKKSDFDEQLIRLASYLYGVDDAIVD